ncbi:ferritin-like domain-containing protein [Gammaproteobacteria bacterium]|nr:ferritin-like domain-containing protein [Gammaproteobacteria bacterium]MDA9340890.1 ferritin-like domain-containing protein [Gammaproteobacteria bacterium]MDA9371239.1 ferritin-like domain-containing protein [Gammaproteobacteria bacterium]MDC1525342.1 ferritin-like domain-containing protein [Gammaproteobacteria bacterium]
MKINYVKNNPRDIRLEEELPPYMTEGVADDIVEIFQTPLAGAYNWDYTIQDNRIKKLYELGKELNWNVEMDIDWSRPFHTITEPVEIFWDEFLPYKKLSDQKKVEFLNHRIAWSQSQFLHGEQGALLVASQLTSCAPTYNAKLYAASQTFDEARHVEAFNKYIQTRIKMMYPIGNALKSILDKILTDPRWDLKFIGMQIIIEGLALAAFQSSRELTRDPVLYDMLGLIIRDEARHVTFGINYLEEFIETLTEEEKEERAQFAFEACWLSRERLLSTDVFERFGWDVEEARQFQLGTDINKHFQKLLFQRVMPNLRRIGLLRDSVKDKFEDLGILEYASSKSDADIDWADLSRPLFEESA